MLGRETATLKQFQNLLGVLNFECKAIVPGRTFLQRLYNKTTKASHPHHGIEVDDGAKKDLKMWLAFLGNHNGWTLILPEDPLSSDTLHL